MKTQARAKIARRAAYAACLGILLSLAPLAFAHQHGGFAAQHSAPSQHAQPQARSESRPQGAPQSRPQQPLSRPGGGYAPARPPQGYGPGGAPGYAPGYSGARPGYNGSPYSMRANPQAAGHLPQWMAQHQNLPVGQQERLLRQEPGFNRLSPGDQQRQVQQLYRLNQMPEAQRQRRLARAEAFERLSPMEQMQVRQSSSRLATLPPDRQIMVRRAFQDLRGVPIDQRETMLNSARYNAIFSPQERGVLSNLLRVEPYEGPR
jgi:Protein of unknown function (DUF3106)